MTQSDRITPAQDPADTNEQATAKLIKQGTNLVDAVDDLRTAIDRQQRTQLVAIVVGAVLVLVLGGVAVDNHSQIDDLKAQMCGAVVGIVPVPGDAPPPAGPEGDRSRDVIQRFRILARDFNCTLRS
jgi:hypothetical protein